MDAITRIKQLGMPRRNNELWTFFPVAKIPAIEFADACVCDEDFSTEEDFAALLRDQTGELRGVVQEALGLPEVDDVDAFAFLEDVRDHLRVAFASLVAEMNSGVQKFVDGDNGHKRSLFGSDRAANKLRAQSLRYLRLVNLYSETRLPADHSIMASISFTAFSRPVKTAREMMECPMFSSSR